MTQSTDQPRRRNRPRDKSVANFWRACRFLYPYRRIVAVSIICALFVGAAFSGGISTMLPIMQVLLKDTTIPQWAHQQVAERRLGVEFSEQADDLVVLRVKHGAFGERAGIKPGDNTLDDTFGGGTKGKAAALDLLSSPDVQSFERAGTSVALPPLPQHLKIGRDLADRMPVNPIAAIATVFGVISALAILSNVLSFFQEYYSDKAAILAVQDIRRRTYDHVLHVPMSQFGARGTSDVTSRLTQDAQELAAGFKTVLGQSIQEPIKAAFAFGLALYVSWQLTLFIILFTPVMGAIIKKLGKKMRRASRAALVSSSSMLGQIEGTLSGIRVVKGASAERFERRRYTRIMDKLVDEQLRMSRIDAFSQPTIQTLTLFVVGAVVLIASYMVLIQHSLDPTSFILVMACLAGIGDSLRRLSKVNNVLQKANAAAARIFEVLDLPVERPRHEGTAEQPRRRINLPPLQREIRFEEITFSYPNATQVAVDDVSLVVPKGKSVAVVGRNGSGKTTLLALLPRFYDPQQGRVLIDGVDVKDATLRSLRGQISIVTQDSVIFPGTIAENIAYGHPLSAELKNPNSPVGKRLMAEVEVAAHKAFAHDFILEKPQGYNTLLGEMGGQLSGGQKQRVCIARAIFRHAPILILDEATSQVDAESEHLIQQAIEKLMHDADATAGRPTTFVIAHRFSTILSADTIVVMDRGRIVAQGKHNELLRDCDTYRQLYERQIPDAPAA